MAFRDARAPEGYRLRPEAAVGSPETSPDGRTYVFRVRQGLRFSDGSRLTAANFKHALDRVLNPAMHSDGAALFSDVKSLSARGRRLTIQLSERSGDLLERLALGYACPVPVDWPTDPAGVPLLVGSGPYYVHDYTPNRQLVLERNPYYFGSRPHRVDRIVTTFGGDPESNARAVKEGRADVLAGVPPFDLVESLARHYGVNRNRLFRVRGTTIYYLALNMSQPLFRRNPALRKAVNFALNRTEIAKAGPGWPHWHRPTDQIVSHWGPAWVDHPLYPLARPNLRRALRLASGNLRAGRAVLYVSQVPFLVDQANVVIRQLSRIHLSVQMKTLAPQVLDRRVGTPGEPYDMVLTRYFVHYPDPADVLIRLLSGENARKAAGNTNFAYFDKPKYNRLMAAADRMTGAARSRAFSNLDAKIMRDAAPWAPLYEGSSWVFYSKRVGCLKAQPVFVLDFAAICVGP